MFHITTRHYLFFIASIFSFSTAADTFDSSSYNRQQNASDSAFEEFDKEFSKPEKPTPKPVAVEPVHEQHEAKTRPTESSIQRQAKKLFNTPELLEISDFTFDLTSCKLQNRNVRCEIKVISLNSDRNLIIINNLYQTFASFYDNQGNRFNATFLRLGNKQVTGKNLSGKLINGIPTKLSIIFEKVSPETTSVSLLDLDAKTSNRTFKIQFRNIPLI